MSIILLNIDAAFAPKTFNLSTKNVCPEKLKILKIYARYDWKIEESGSNSRYINSRNNFFFLAVVVVVVVVFFVFI